jgi:uncharacterized protein YceH (UPF0502 family)
MNELEPSDVATTLAKKWQPLADFERRIVGVLIEKAKTTPDGYPMSLNSLVNGCNQKSNRYPQMQLTDRQVENALEALRSYGAVTEVQGSGRVPRYRHHMKEWLGVEGNELAVMAELLLRGSQSIGDLRGRAARMAAGQLPDVATLRPVLDSLIQKKLVLELTPPGRGQWVTHALYSAAELDRERRRAATAATDAGEDAPRVRPTQTESHQNEFESLRDEVMQLREEVQTLAAEMASLRELLTR